jgi:hypothetical protein
MRMNSTGKQKVTARHLSRSAYLYVRQSTMRQVMENTESSSVCLIVAPSCMRQCPRTTR